MPANKSKPETLAYLIVGLLCYALAATIAWTLPSFSSELSTVISIFTIVFILLGTLGILLAAVTFYLSKTRPRD